MAIHPIHGSCVLLLFTALTGLAGCGNTASRVPASGLVLMTAPTDWSSLIGTEVQVVGHVSRSKVPTILGIEVDADSEQAGKRATATGVVDAIIIAEPNPADPPAAMRGPGTYYRLINPKTQKLAIAELVREDR